MKDAIPAIALFGVILTGLAGWLTHIFWFFGAVTAGTATAGTWLFFLVALIVAPLGTLHGIWLWFN